MRREKNCPEVLGLSSALCFFLSSTGEEGRKEGGILFSCSHPKSPVLGRISMRPQRTLVLPLH